MLAKSPNDRPQTWGEVKKFLESYRASRRPTAVQETRQPEKTAAESKLPRILLISAGILLGIVLAAGIGVLVWLRTLEN